jgi:hypothetical protein
LRTVIDGVSKMIKTGADVYEGLIVGGVVVVAVAFNQFRQAGRQGKSFFAGPLGLVTVLNLALLTGVLVMVALPGSARPSATSGSARPFPSQVSIGTLVGVVTLAFLLLARFIEGRRARR